MPRNLDSRVELLGPIENPSMQAELDDTLERCLADDTYGWVLSSDGSWHRRGGGTRSVHAELMERTLEESATATQ
jgi:polyphosphate kinase